MKKNKNILPDNKNPFNVPEGYFDGFTERIMERVDSEDASYSNEPTIGIMRYLRPALIMAVSFAAIFLIIFVPVKIIGPKTSSDYTSVNNENILLNYFQINERTIIEAFEFDTIQSDYNNAVVEEYLMASISEYDLVDNKY
jgi:hypothetical protein